MTLLRIYALIARELLLPTKLQALSRISHRCGCLAEPVNLDPMECPCNWISTKASYSNWDAASGCLLCSGPALIIGTTGEHSPNG